MTAAERTLSPDLMTFTEVAEYLGISKHGLSSMLARGEIPGAHRFGRRWRVSRLAFMRALHGAEPAGEPEEAE